MAAFAGSMILLYYRLVGRNSSCFHSNWAPRQQTPNAEEPVDTSPKAEFITVGCRTSSTAWELSHPLHEYRKQLYLWSTVIQIWPQIIYHRLCCESHLLLQALWPLQLEDGRAESWLPPEKSRGQRFWTRRVLSKGCVSQGSNVCLMGEKVSPGIS